MRKLKFYCGKAAMAVTSVALLAGPAMAEPTFTITAPDIPYQQLGTYASAILTALAGIWVIRKMIKTTNRS